MINEQRSVQAGNLYAPAKEVDQLIPSWAKAPEPVICATKVSFRKRLQIGTTVTTHELPIRH